MKSSFKPSSVRYVFFLVASSFFFSCQKQIDKPAQPQELSTSANNNNEHGHLKQTKEYSSEVVFKWINMQLRLMSLSPAGIPVTRIVGYTGLALYESVVGGMPAYQSLAGQLNQFPVGDMPSTLPGYAYHWPTNANATLAAMTRSFFPADANKVFIDSLENALNNEYKNSVSLDQWERSAAFGKKVANVVFEWSKTDGANHANDPYNPPVGAGLWVPTPPAFATAFAPYWKNNRTLVNGSLNGADAPSLPAYSGDPSSDFYNMVKEVYDISQTLTAKQKEQALYYRDNPGYGNGHYLSILKIIMQKEELSLDLSAVTYAKTGIALVDAGIGCWKVKYTYNNLRPITYIRDVMGYTTWNSLQVTPPFPDYISAHSSLAGAAAEVLTSIFGDNYAFDNNTYSYLGMPDQHYASFYDMARQIGDARVLAGIHYRISCTEGVKLGQKVAQNILSTLKFLKE